MKSKKVVIYVSGLILAFSVGISMAFVILNSPNRREKEVRDSSNVDEVVDDKHEIKKVSNEDLNKKLYSLLQSSWNQRVYQNVKFDSSKLSLEKIVLSTANYIALNHENELMNLTEFNGVSGYFYGISFENIKKYSKILFGKDINSLPAYVSTIYSHSTWLDYDVKTSSMVFNLEFYEQGTKPSQVLQEDLGWSKDKDVIFEKTEIVGDEVFVYDKLILNADIDFNFDKGKISKFDGSDTIDCTKNCDIESLQKSYPDYFTTYKHTFKIRNNGEYYTYISSEPIN